MSGSKPASPRPLSPHLQIWRFHATMYASIIHRLTGVALYFGSFLIAAWLGALALGPEAYRFAGGIVSSLPGKILLFLWCVAVLFHFANGIRHLLWDGPGVGFSPGLASKVSVFNFVFALFGAAAIWAAVSHF